MTIESRTRLVPLGEKLAACSYEQDINGLRDLLRFTMYIYHPNEYKILHNIIPFWGIKMSLLDPNKLDKVFITDKMVKASPGK